jgi:hypothetical protein
MPAKADVAIQSFSQGNPMDRLFNRRRRRMMIVSDVVLLAFFVVASVATAILQKLGEKWYRLPHFVYNYVGGVWAVCSIADFKKTVPIKFQIGLSGKVTTFRLVSETLAFIHHPVAENAKRFSGVILWDGEAPWPIIGHFHPIAGSSELFVPFASEGYLAFDQQERMFVAPQVPVEFIRKKRRENLESDYRLRFEVWARKRDLGAWKVWFVLFSIIMFLVSSYTFSQDLKKKNDARLITTHVTTADGAVEEIQTTGKEQNKLLMDESFGGRDILKGRVTKILSVGGGSSRACIARSGKKLTCGFAALSLHIKEGDEAYIRTAKLLRGERGEGDFEHANDGWLITKAEAEKLVSTGTFKIIE